VEMRAEGAKDEQSMPRQLMRHIKCEQPVLALKCKAVTGVCGIEIQLLYIQDGSHATRADPAQLRARAQPNAVGHAEQALVLGLGAAR
jgi:hypothetical protein